MAGFEELGLTRHTRVNYSAITRAKKPSDGRAFSVTPEDAEINKKLMAAAKVEEVAGLRRAAPHVRRKMLAAKHPVVRRKKVNWWDK